MQTKTLFVLAATGCAAFIALAVPQPLSGQNALTPSAPAAEVSPKVAALISELTAQNKQLTANQTAMEEKIAALGETIRQARLFSARGGNNLTTGGKQ